MFGSIKWKQKTEVPGSLRQEAYADSSDYFVPFMLTPEGEKMMANENKRNEVINSIRNAVARQGCRGSIAGSSWGAQSYRLKRIDFNNYVLTVEHSVGIGE